MISKKYIAGFFDGEGCISTIESFLVTKYVKYPRVQLQISVTNTCEGILQEISEIYGGLVRPQNTLPNRTQCYSWTLTGKQQMRKFLEDILQYLYIKRNEALLALEFIETLREENLGSVGLDAGIHTLRHEIHLKLRKRKSLKSHKPKGPGE